MRRDTWRSRQRWTGIPQSGDGDLAALSVPLPAFISLHPCSLPVGCMCYFAGNALRPAYCPLSVPLPAPQLRGALPACLRGAASLHVMLLRPPCAAACKLTSSVLPCARQACCILGCPRKPCTPGTGCVECKRRMTARQRSARNHVGNSPTDSDYAGRYGCQCCAAPLGLANAAMLRRQDWSRLGSRSALPSVSWPLTALPSRHPALCTVVTASQPPGEGSRR